MEKEKNKQEEKQEKTVEKTAEKIEEKKEEKKRVEAAKKEKKITEEKRKEKATVYGKNLGMSTKQAVAICDFIRYKKIENAVKELQEVLKMKRAIPMRGEIPHRKGMMSGRYPLNACGIFIKLLKGLNANCAVAGIEEPFILTAKADVASRPYRRFGSTRFKRTNVYLVAKEKQEEKIKEK